MSVNLIFCDIDGCLSPEESIPWDHELFWELVRLSQEATAGLGNLAPLALCSGRPQPYIEVLMKILNIQVPGICENGAVLYSLPENLARYGPGVTQEKIETLRSVRSFLEEKILSAHSDIIYQFGKEAQLSLYSEHPESFGSIQQKIETFVKKINGTPLLITNSHYYLNISMAGVDKGTTLKFLLRELGIDRNDTAGIGDTEGDLPLRDNVKFFACPANARPKIKEVADYVSPYESLKGTLDILKRPELQRGA